MWPVRPGAMTEQMAEVVGARRAAESAGTTALPACEFDAVQQSACLK